MEKIFVRSSKLDRAMDFEENSCRTKKEQKAYRKYVWKLKRAEYQAAAKPYIVETPETYIRTLISRIKKLEDTQSNLSQVEKEQLFQALALFCVRPKLFFNKALETDNRHATDKDVKAFEKELRRFDREWASFAAEIQLCKRYMFRGTRDLDRLIGLDVKLTPDEEIRLKDILNDIYRAYYYELKAIGLNLSTLPSVNDTLLHNCIEKQWLLPLSHVILIRDAQCQMMGRMKYKKEALLLGGSGVTKIDTSNLTEKQKYICGNLTYAYTLNIRAALAKALEGKLRSDIKTAFAHLFHDELKKITDENKKMMKELPHLSAVLGASNLFASWRLRDQIDEFEKLDIAPFSVPDCYIETLALRIAAKMELSVEQLQVLIKELPNLFWTNISLKTWLSQLNIFEESEAASLNKELDTLLSPICTLLNPNEYFSAPKNVSEMSGNLTRAAKVLNPRFGEKPRPDNTKSLWNVFSDMVYFHDLTRPALLLSGAIDVEHCPEDLLFSWISHYIDKLNDWTKQYKKRKYIIRVLGMEPLTDSGKHKFKQLQKNPDFDAQKLMIMKHIIGIDNIDGLALERADQLWSRPEFSLAGSQSGFVEKLTTAATKGTDRPGERQKLYTLSLEEKGYLCLIVYKQLIKHSISLIRREAARVLLKKSLELASAADSEDKAKGSSEDSGT